MCIIQVCLYLVGWDVYRLLLGPPRDVCTGAVDPSTKLGYTNPFSLLATSIYWLWIEVGGG